MSQYGTQPTRYGRQEPAGGPLSGQEQGQSKYPETGARDQSQYASQDTGYDNPDSYGQGEQYEDKQKDAEQYGEEDYTSNAHPSQAQQAYRGQTPDPKAQPNSPHPQGPYGQDPRSAQQSSTEGTQPNGGLLQNSNAQGSHSAQQATFPPSPQPEVNGRHAPASDPVAPTNGPVAPLNGSVAPSNSSAQQNLGTGRKYHKSHHNALFHMSATAKLGFTGDHMDSFLHLGTYALGALADTHGLAPEKGHPEGQDY